MGKIELWIPSNYKEYLKYFISIYLWMLFFLIIFKDHYLKRVFGLNSVTFLPVKKSAVKCTSFLCSEFPDLVIQPRS